MSGVLDPADWPPSPKVVGREQLRAIREQARREGKRVVWTNGCFDLFHIGHLRSLQMARRHGDLLIVGVNADATVRALKGPGRPIVPEAERAEILAGLECVDYVTVFAEPTPEAAVAELRPDVCCKGSDYAPPHGKPIPEAAVVEGYGGVVVFLPMIPGRSTSELINRVSQREGYLG